MKKLFLIISLTASLYCINIFGQSIKNTPGKDKIFPSLFQMGVISTGEYETHPAFTPTGDTLYFLKCTPDANFYVICVSYRIDGKWSSPEIASFSGKYLDADPFVTKDGNTLYFVSNRPISGTGPVKDDWDIWKTKRGSRGWEKPVHLDSMINSDANEYYPTIADNGNLYFGSSRKGGKGNSDIYVSRFINNKYTEPENLGNAINSGDNEYEPFIAPDESYLIFMATIPNGLNNADFYISFNINGHWTQSQKLPEYINSSVVDWGGKVTRDGKYFFFGSNRNKISTVLPQRENMQQFSIRLNTPGNGLGDIYRVSADFIMSLRDKLK